MCRSRSRDGRKSSMALANERRHSAPAKAALAVLAHYRFVQNLLYKRGSCPASRLGCSRSVGCADFFDRGKAHELLARLYCGPDLSQLLRHISARAHRHARTDRQRVHRRGDSLCSRRLSATPISVGVVRWILDLLGFCMLDQRFARRGLSGGDCFFAVDVLSRGAAAVQVAVALAVRGHFPSDRLSLAFMG